MSGRPSIRRTRRSTIGEVGDAAGCGDRLDREASLEPFEAVPEPDAAAEEDGYEHDA
jgi:hypothetical protein